MSDELKRALLGMGLCEVLVPLTSSENVEVQGNSAAALSNLSSMGKVPRLFLTLIEAGDYSTFVKTWETPGDGLQGFLLRFLASKDEIDQHIAVWTLTQLLESNGAPPSEVNLISDHEIQKLILQTPELLDLLRTILREATAPDEAIDDSDFEDESGDENVEEGNEVVSLARTALVSLKKLPTLDELEGTTSTKEGEQPSKGEEEQALFGFSGK